MIISAKIIKKARKRKWCFDCEERLIGPHLDLFGMADPGDHPYTIHQCLDCAEEMARTGTVEDQMRVRKALGI